MKTLESCLTKVLRSKMWKRSHTHTHTHASAQLQCTLRLLRLQLVIQGIQRQHFKFRGSVEVRVFENAGRDPSILTLWCRGFSPRVFFKKFSVRSVNMCRTCC